MRRPFAFTLVEMLIACTLLGLLLTVLFAIFFQGARAWLLSDSRSDLQGQATLLLHQVTREAQQSSAVSLSTDGEALSFLSARDGDGKFQNAQGQPLWQKMVVYYRHSDDTLRRRVLPLPAPREVPSPIEDLDFGSGPRALGFYLSEGKVAARLVKRFQPSQPSAGMLTITVDLAQKVGGSADRTTARELTTTVMIRNP